MGFSSGTPGAANHGNNIATRTTPGSTDIFPPGNMTGDGTLTYKYDAWNRLTEADQGANVVATYRYDGLNRRVSKAVAVYVSEALTGYDRTDYQYDEAWQVLEERFTADQCSAATVATAPHAQYVWDLRYVDAPVLRLRDTAGPSCSQPDGDLDDSGDEVVYYTNDANMNVTALVNTSGEVVERYAYEAYGAPTILNGVKDAAGTNTSTSEWDERTVATFQNEILNNGYRYNYETGNSQVREREQLTPLGRWATRDSGGYADGSNLYLYVGDSPVGFLDPLGTAKQATTQPASQPASMPDTGFPIPYTRAGKTVKAAVHAVINAEVERVGTAKAEIVLKIVIDKDKEGYEQACRASGADDAWANLTGCLAGDTKHHSSDRKHGLVLARDYRFRNGREVQVNPPTTNAVNDDKSTLKAQWTCTDPEKQKAYARAAEGTWKTDFALQPLDVDSSTTSLRLPLKLPQGCGVSKADKGRIAVWFWYSGLITGRPHDPDQPSSLAGPWIVEWSTDDAGRFKAHVRLPTAQEKAQYQANYSFEGRRDKDSATTTTQPATTQPHWWNWGLTY